MTSDQVAPLMEVLYRTLLGLADVFRRAADELDQLAAATRQFQAPEGGTQ